MSTTFDDWLDGRLDADAARAFEERLTRDPALAEEARAARDVDDALRRRFAPPEDPAEFAPGLIARNEPVLAPKRAAESGTSPWPAAAMLAGAAGIVALLQVGSAPERAVDPVDPVDRVDTVAAATPPPPLAVDRFANAPEWSLDSCVGPLRTADPERDLARIVRPDIETLYQQATRWTSAPEWNACTDEQELVGALAASYGETVALTPEASNVLQGPFASEEWPTGTVLAAHPDDATVVLVAERDTTHRCCVRLEVPEGSDLQLFTWRVGGLVLTEITPFTEPRLLGYFVEGGDEGELR
jgi:hypothetical protein